MSYPGSKASSGTWQRIIGQMPPHRTYIEAFFGSGQVWQRKRPASINVAVDTLRRVLPAPSDGTPFVQVVHDSFMAWGERTLLYGPDDCEDTLIYCDPPYMLSTRNGRKYYEHELSDDQHARLLALLRSLHSRVLLSGYPSALYNRLLAHWRCIRYRTMTRGGPRIECLWANYPEPDQLHDWRYAGQTYRQRLSFRRLAARYLARLQGMHPRKRGYVLNAIVQRQDWRCPRPASDLTPWTVTPVPALSDPK